MYQQVKDLIIGRISNGELKPRDRVPSENEILLDSEVGMAHIPPDQTHPDPVGWNVGHSDLKPLRRGIMSDVPFKECHRSAGRPSETYEHFEEFVLTVTVDTADPQDLTTVNLKCDAGQKALPLGGPQRNVFDLQYVFI